MAREPARGLSIDQNDDDNHPFPAIPSDDSQDSEYNPTSTKEECIGPTCQKGIVFAKSIIWSLACSAIHT